MDVRPKLERADGGTGGAAPASGSGPPPRELVAEAETKPDAAARRAALIRCRDGPSSARATSATSATSANEAAWAQHLAQARPYPTRTTMGGAQPQQQTPGARQMPGMPQTRMMAGMPHPYA